MNGRRMPAEVVSAPDRVSLASDTAGALCGGALGIAPEASVVAAATGSATGGAGWRSAESLGALTEIHHFRHQLLAVAERENITGAARSRLQSINVRTPTLCEGCIVNRRSFIPPRFVECSGAGRVQSFQNRAAPQRLCQQSAEDAP